MRKRIKVQWINPRVGPSQDQRSILGVILKQNVGLYRNECPFKKGKKFDNQDSTINSDSNFFSTDYESFEVLVVSTERLETM